MFATVNRNKRSIVLDLKQSDGVAILRRRCNLRCGRAELFVPERRSAWETASDDMRSEREDIIYLSISGIRPGWDPTPIARSTTRSCRR